MDWPLHFLCCLNPNLEITYLKACIQMFINFGTTNIVNQIIICFEGLVGCLALSLDSTHWIPVEFPVVTTKNISRHGRVSLRKKGQTDLWLRITALYRLKQ